VFRMVNASFSRLRQQLDPTVVRILAAALAVILIGVSCAMIWCFGGGSVAALPPSATAMPAPARGQVSDEILETAKALQVTQQQAVDQLQVVQDQLAAQKAETKKLSEQIAAITEKLDALQQAIASIPAPTVAAPVSPPKARHQ
jgi:septal ring factor EnvC (AmiA/AmiB activator)